MNEKIMHVVAVDQSDIMMPSPALRKVYTLVAGAALLFSSACQGAEQNNDVELGSSISAAETGLSLDGTEQLQVINPPQSTEVPFTYPAPINLSYDELPIGGCVDSYSIDKNSAADCVQQQRGKVALVLFDTGNPEVLDATKMGSVAHGAEILLNETTGGILAPTIVPIVASDAAMAAFTIANKNLGCVNVKDAESWSSSAADETMNLNDYDSVIAISDVQPCDKNVLGIADKSTARHIELFDKDQYSEAVLTRVISHEFGHLAGMLGHDGSLLCADTEGNRTDIWGSSEDTQVFDFSAYIAGCKSYVYGYAGTDALMGNVSENTSNLTINAVHEARLKRASELVKGNTADSIKKVFAEPVTITPEEAAIGSFATVQLAELLTPETVEANGDVSAYISYDAIAVVPLMSDEGDGHAAGKEVWGTQLILINSYLNNTNTVGTLLVKPTDATNAEKTLVLGSGQSIRISLAPDGTVLVQNDVLASTGK